MAPQSTMQEKGRRMRAWISFNKTSTRAASQRNNKKPQICLPSLSASKGCKGNADHDLWSMVFARWLVIFYRDQPRPPPPLAIPSFRFLWSHRLWQKKQSSQSRLDVKILPFPSFLFEERVEKASPFPSFSLSAVASPPLPGEGFLFPFSFTLCSSCWMLRGTWVEPCNLRAINPSMLWQQARQTPSWNQEASPSRNPLAAESWSPFLRFSSRSSIPTHSYREFPIAIGGCEISNFVLQGGKGAVLLVVFVFCHFLHIASRSWSFKASVYVMFGCLVLLWSSQSKASHVVQWAKQPWVSRTITPVHLSEVMEMPTYSIVVGPKAALGVMPHSIHMGELGCGYPLSFCNTVSWGMCMHCGNNVFCSCVDLLLESPLEKGPEQDLSVHIGGCSPFSILFSGRGTSETFRPSKPPRKDVQLWSTLCDCCFRSFFVLCSASLGWLSQERDEASSCVILATKHCRWHFLFLTVGVIASAFRVGGQLSTSTPPTPWNPSHSPLKDGFLWLKELQSPESLQGLLEVYHVCTSLAYAATWSCPMHIAARTSQSCEAFQKLCHW